MRLDKSLDTRALCTLGQLLENTEKELKASHQSWTPVDPKCRMNNACLCIPDWCFQNASGTIAVFHYLTPL